MSERRLLVASHRGPITYRTVRGRVVAQRGGGGLINVVRPVAERHHATWIASALTPEDADLAGSPRGRDEASFNLRLLDLPADAHSGHYDVVCNETLWYIFHYLYDIAEEPSFGPAFWHAWDGYREINRIYADAVVAQPRADAVLVHDYHLMTMAAELRRRQWMQAPLIYFHHAPWSEPDYFGLLPMEVALQILQGMLSHDVVGFHADRWANAFLRCCQRYLPGVDAADDEVTWRRRTTKVVVAPAARDLEEVIREGSSAEALERLEALNSEREGRLALVRVERIDLSKNVLRGLLAFEAVLERRPELAKEVWFLAFGYMTRQKVARYRRYYESCRTVAARINQRFQSGRNSSGPLWFDVQDDLHRSMAGLRLADATLVNPVFDGLNLVAKEAALLNERNGSLILSRNAGVFEELGEGAIGVNPFDVRETTAAIERALAMPDAERRRRASRLRRTATMGTPEGWLRGQLMAAGI